MAKEKEYSNRALVAPEEESPLHKKKSKTSSRSLVEKRSKHKHDYESVIIDSGFVENIKFFWGKRCRICGRVDDSGMFKQNATKGLVKRTEKVTLKSGETSTFKIFYSAKDLKKLFPDAPIIRCVNYGKREYEEI